MFEEPEQDGIGHDKHFRKVEPVLGGIAIVDVDIALRGGVVADNCMLVAIRHSIHWRPRHCRIRRAGLNVDRPEPGEVGRWIVRTRLNAVSLQRLVTPEQLRNVRNVQRRAADSLKLGAVVEPRPGLACERHESDEHVPLIYLNERRVKRIASRGHIPARDRPVRSAARSRGAPLQNRLKNAVVGSVVLDAVEEEDCLP